MINYRQIGMIVVLGISAGLLGCSSSSKNDASGVPVSFSVTNSGTSQLQLILACGENMSGEPTGVDCQLPTWVKATGTGCTAGPAISLNQAHMPHLTEPTGSTVSFVIAAGGKCSLSTTTTTAKLVSKEAGLELQVVDPDSPENMATCTDSNPVKIAPGNTSFNFPSMSCKLSTSYVKIVANNTISPTQVSLIAPNKNIQSVPSHKNSITLKATNHYSSKLALSDNANYNITVNPPVNSEDEVANYPHSLTQHTQTLLINYKASHSKLIGRLSIKKLSSYDLGVTPFNKLELTGLFNSDGTLNTTAHTILTNTHFPSYVTIFAVLPTIHLTQLATILAGLPSRISGITLQVTHVDKSLVTTLHILSTLKTNQFIILNLVQAPTSAELSNLKSILYPVKKNGLTIWVEAADKDISNLSSTVDARQLIIDAHVMKGADLTALLKHYRSQAVDGIVLAPKQVTQSIKLKHTIFRVQ